MSLPTQLRTLRIDCLLANDNVPTRSVTQRGAFEISHSLNFEHVFQGFLRQFEVGKRSQTVSRCVQPQHGENFDRAIFVKRGSFEPESSFFEQNSFRKELFTGKYFVTKEHVRSKKTENEQVLSERIFTFVPVVLKNRLFLTFQKFKFLDLIF